MGKLLGGNLKNIPLMEIDRPKGIVRLDISDEAIEELAASIAQNGLLQPIVARTVGGRYEIIAGDRRFLACTKLGWKQIPAIIRDAGDRAVAVSRATENLSRVDLTPVEEAAVYHDMVEKHKMTWQEVATAVGKSPGIVKRRLLIMKMPPNVQRAVHEGKITMQVSEELWSLGDLAAMDYYLGYCVDHGATVAVVRTWVKDYKRSKEKTGGGGGGGDSPQAEYESRPVYVPCDVCNSPMQVGEETIYRACPDCSAAIRNAARQSKN